MIFFAFSLKYRNFSLEHNDNSFPWINILYSFNVNKTTESTGRSAEGNHPFPFPLKDFHFPTINSGPSNHRSSHVPRIIYASSPVSRKYEWIKWIDDVFNLIRLQKLHRIDLYRVNLSIILLIKIIKIVSSFRQLWKNVS